MIMVIIQPAICNQLKANVFLREWHKKFHKNYITRKVFSGKNCRAFVSLSNWSLSTLCVLFYWYWNSTKSRRQRTRSTTALATTPPAPSWVESAPRANSTQTETLLCKEKKEDGISVHLDFKLAFASAYSYTSSPSRPTDKGGSSSQGCERHRGIGSSTCGVQAWRSNTLQLLSHRSAQVRSGFDTNRTINRCNRRCYPRTEIDNATATLIFVFYF